MSDSATTTAGGLELQLTYPDPEAYDNELAALIRDQVASRITAQDPTLWGPQAQSESAIRLSWVSLAESSRPLVAEILELREELRSAGLTHVVLAGMGGSSLAPEVICATAGVDLLTLDTTDAGQIRAALDPTQLPRTVLVVSSKSGSTVETDSHRRVYEKAFTDAGIDPRQRIIAVTDPGSPLQKTAEDAGYRVFLADPNVGGRYSALTAFGLVPAGLAGADISALLDEAAQVSLALAADDDQNPGLRLGALLGLAHNSGSDKVVFADFDSGIVGFGNWAEQLIAESTGKDGKGLLPVVVEGGHAPGFSDAGVDAILIHLGGSDAIQSPASGWGASVDGPLGGQMLVWEYATAVAGRIIGINPFDQPNVEAAKIQARSLLDAPDKVNDDKPTFIDGAVEVYADPKHLPAEPSLGALIESLSSLAPEHGYLAIQAYLDRHHDSSASDLRASVAAKTGLQTTFGWGPRFLHSTGQYHKGGHRNGAFIQITGVVAEDLAIPQRPYSFATLQAAQAAGDASVLADTGQPVLRLHLTDRAAGIGQLLGLL